MEAAIIDEWDKEAEKEVEEEEIEEKGLQRKRVLLQRSNTSSSSDKDIQGGGLEFNKSEKKEESEVIITQIINTESILIQQVDIDKTRILPVSSHPPQIIHEGSYSLTNETSEIRTIGIVKENEDGRQELYLERVYEKPPNSGFYCPNCKACIQTVYILKEQPSNPAKPMQQPKPIECIRCTSCFSFLIPIGSWLFPCLKSDDDGALNDQEEETTQATQATQETAQDEALKQDQSKEETTQPGSKDTSKPDNNIANDYDSGKDKNIIKDVVPLGPGPKEISSDGKDEVKSPGPESIIPAKNEKEEKDQVAQKKKKKPFWINWLVIGGASDEASIPKTHKEDDSTKISDWKVIPEAPHTKPPKKLDFPSDEQKPDHVEVTVIDEGSTDQSEQPVTDESTALLPSRELPVPTRSSNKRLEILKSIVYGGLVESLASLSVVTSAASADATTLNIVALSIANLIGGLFVLGHNLRELKAEEPKQPENQTDTRVDRYNELLGQRENFILHVFISVLSFIIFGLIPPIVYGFSFQESDEKYYKLAAVAVSSLICVILLSIAKAHIQRPRSYVTYFQTVVYYVTTGAVASVISYLAGQLVDKILEKLGWFEPKTSDFVLKVRRHEMNEGKTSWSSY